MAAGSRVETVKTHVAALVEKGLQWMRAENVHHVISRLLCLPLPSGLEEDSVCIQAAQPPQPLVVNQYNFYYSTFNDSNLTSQAGPQAGPDLLQMPPELPIHGECRSVHISHCVLNNVMFGDHTTMTVDQTPKIKSD